MKCIEFELVNQLQKQTVILFLCVIFSSYRIILQEHTQLKKIENKISAQQSCSNKDHRCIITIDLHCKNF